MSFVPLERNALRLGLYIRIEGSWFNHPFSTNSFKIKTTKDLVKLKGLSNLPLSVDFTRSDPEPKAQSDAHDPSLDSSQALEDTEFSAEEETTQTSLSETAKPVDEAIHRKAEQREAFRAYQTHLQQVQEQFQEVLQKSKQTVQDVVAGRPRGLRTAKQVVGNLLNLLDGPENSRALLNLMSSNEPNEGFFLHATNVCCLSLMVGVDLGISRDDNEKLALGAFFHDVGELKYPVETLMRKDAMGRNDLKTFVSTHPRYGMEMVEKIPTFPSEAIDVIHQHHERLNGSGLPLGAKEANISTFSKIVMVVDLYDELCHHPDPARSLIPSEALSYLYVKCRQTLWQKAIVSLVKQLGVYPPGSLVNLSNQKIGIVTSVNFDNRLRPIVLVYDEHSSTNEPLVLNLADEDHTLTIVNAIRPGDLAPHIRECLNPRQIISYFPSQAPALESCST